MSFTDDELRFEFVLKSTFGGLLTGGAERDAWVYRQAEDLHARMAADAVRDIAFKAVLLAAEVRERDAAFHLQFGLAHRTKFIWLALRRLLAIAPPERTEPVSLDDVDTLASDLNVIYLNIRGALDNLAWCVRAVSGSEAAKGLRDVHMDLFGTTFLTAIGDDELSAALEPFRGWYGDLKSRRDPAAHRIPLTVPPAILDDAEQDEYRRLNREHSAAVGRAMEATRQRLDASADRPFSLAEAEDIEALFEDAETLHAERQTVGKFPGLFAHHPDERAVPIYPTVPDDIGTLVAIARAVATIVERRLAAQLG